LVVSFLSSCGSRLPRLREQLSDPDPDVRIEAVKALAEAKDTASVPRFCEMLMDPEPDVRKEVAKGLGRIGDDRAAQPLADFYNRETIEDVADAGARALILLGDASVPPLLSLLRSIKPGVRAGAARALGKLHAHAAVDPLILALRDRDERVQVAAVYALREIADPRGLDAIYSAIQSGDVEVQGAGEEALSGRGYDNQLLRAKKVARQLPYP
jgi:HEAT repeat protein